jgi:dihydroorotate dehydrogenase
MYYNIDQTFEQNIENYRHWPICDLRSQWPEVSTWQDFLGYKLALPIGVAACPITIGEGIRHLANYGFSILTYKTIRHTQYKAYQPPNLSYINAKDLLMPNNLQQTWLTATNFLPNAAEIALTNSFGNASLAPDWIAQDIALTKAHLISGQVLNVSVYGEASTDMSQLDAFVAAARLAKNAGADMIEINFSCPNLQEQLFIADLAQVFTIAKKVVQAVTPLPVSIKMAFDDNPARIKLTLQEFARAGIRAISAINSVPMKVLNMQAQPVFGNSRKVSGVSGFPIKQLALNFIETISHMNQQQQWGFKILGIGGVTEFNDFDKLLNAGADVALSATAVIQNPMLLKNHLCSLD